MEWLWRYIHGWGGCGGAAVTTHPQHRHRQWRRQWCRVGCYASVGAPPVGRAIAIGNVRDLAAQVLAVRAIDVAQPHSEPPPA